MIQHHPSEATLTAYAAGKLAHALGLVSATHLARCSTCRATLAILEATGGALLTDLPPAMLSADALERVLGRLDEAPTAPPPLLCHDLPPPLNRVPLGRWWPIGAGIRYRPFKRSTAACGGLLLAQPGRSLPRHTHEGLELTCVVSGAYADGSGHYTEGDLSEKLHADHDQTPTVVGLAPCLCVVAFEGLRLQGLLGWAQRMTGQ